MNILETYLCSTELKKVIISRVREHNIPIRYICNAINVSYAQFMQSYINSMDGTKCNITEYQFEKMLDILGIEPRVQFVVKSDFNGQKVKDKLKRKYEEERDASIPE